MVNVRVEGCTPRRQCIVPIDMTTLKDYRNKENGLWRQMLTLCFSFTVYSLCITCAFTHDAPEGCVCTNHNARRPLQPTSVMFPFFNKLYLNSQLTSPIWL